MLKNALMITALAFFSTALAGCHLYFEDDDGGNNRPGYTYCDETGCYDCDDWGCYPGDGRGEPGWTCTSNYDCAGGCYCSDDGFCEEAGFCSNDSECAPGFECDDRASCVPEGSTDVCTSDASCPSGSFCDEQSGACVGSWTCDDGAPGADESCGMGFECDERNTCVPQPCTDDGMCQEGCYCDEVAGDCIETATCDASGGCFGDLVCDLDRNTCVPPDEIGPTCQGDVFCEIDPPVCPVGSTPAIESGCYTGACMAKTDCPDGAPFECSDLNNDENACIGNNSCSTVYKGVNCTSPGGDECTGGSVNCTCESFEYDYCEAI